MPQPQVQLGWVPWRVIFIKENRTLSVYIQKKHGFKSSSVHLLFVSSISSHSKRSVSLDASAGARFSYNVYVYVCNRHVIRRVRIHWICKYTCFHCTINH